MVIEVVLFANYREAVGEKRIKIPAETVDELLRKIIDKYPELEEEIFVDKERGELRDYLNIAINSQKINDVNERNIELEDSDIVRIFPPVSGG